MPRRFLVLMTALAVLGAACGNDDRVGAGDPPTSTTEVRTLAETTDDGLRLSLGVEPDPAVAGEAITWTLTLVNERDAAVDLTFASGQQADLVLLDAAGREAYRWSEDRAFVQVVSEEQLARGEELVVVLEDGLTVEPGEYAVRATITADPEPPVLETTLEVVDG